MKWKRGKKAQQEARLAAQQQLKQQQRAAAAARLGAAVPLVLPARPACAQGAGPFHQPAYADDADQAPGARHQEPAPGSRSNSPGGHQESAGSAPTTTASSPSPGVARLEPGAERECREPDEDELETGWTAGGRAQPEAGGQLGWAGLRLAAGGDADADADAARNEPSSS